MSNRATRRPPVHSLTPCESLLLAQAVWELGAGQNSWTAVAKLLGKHPLLSRPKSFFTPQSCHAMYENLLKDAELDPDESNHLPHAPTNLQLAQKHFRIRFLELRELIMTEEAKFKHVLKEIEEIRAGLWDKETEAELTSEAPTGHESPKHLLELNTDKPSDEVFGGSDLSGVTESAESGSSPSQNREEHISSAASIRDEARQEEASQTPSVQQEQANEVEESLLPSVAQPTVEQEDIEVDTPKTNHTEALQLLEDLPSKSPTITAEETLQADVRRSPMALDISPSHLGRRPQGHEKRIDTEGIRPSQDVKTTEEQGDQEHVGKNVVQRQEEEEEEVNQEEESREEEEETPREQTESDPDRDDSLENTSVQADLETESETLDTPAPEAAVINNALSDAGNDGHTSGDEPVMPTRRSSRRRKSSATSVPPPQTKKRLRSRGRISTEPQMAMESENDGDTDVKEETPQAEDDQMLSPYDGALTRRREGKRKASFVEGVESPPDKKRMREDSEPVEEEEHGPSFHSTRTRVTRHAMRTEEQVALKRFQNVIGMLHSQISQHRNGNIFHNPIKNSEAPDYHEIVKRPMDLKTIKTRVKDGIIGNSLEFQRDIYLMFANAMMYNRPGSDVHAMAEDMMLESEGQILAFRQTEGLVKRGQRP
ncbi:hypothetical protein B0H34DRAFT_688675 [Crassisporium funariophilum]|nr:hypothetical protein B0H34DRAFT_688675 [Crassisporium funariophilum]